MVQPWRPDSPHLEWFIVAVQTVCMSAELVGVHVLLWNLLANSVGLTRELTCNGSKSPPYIDEGVWPIEPPIIDPIKPTYHIYLICIVLSIP
jgi:hypothetical protein